MRVSKTVLAAVGAALVLTACGGPSGSPSADEEVQLVEEAPPGSPQPGQAASDGAGETAAQPEILAARAQVAAIEVYAEPSADAPPVMTLPATTELGSTTTFLVAEVDDDFIQVLLPVRPNGSTGWVSSDDVELRSIDYEIRVDLGARELLVLQGGLVVLESEVAIGTTEAPTPTGLHYVTDRVETPDPGGAYGPFAFGLSAHSDTLTEFAGGDGQVGVHGTNDPSSIGRAVSHGCIRLPNEVISQLADLIPLGTPVWVT